MAAPTPPGPTTGVGAPCPVCGASGARELFPCEVPDPAQVSFDYSFRPGVNRVFRTVRCAGCTHVYCTPIPADIHTHYADVVDPEYLRQEATRRLTAAAVLETIAAHAPRGRLLDVGCATGDFLVVARERGYAAEGLELSRWSGDIAASRGFVVHRRLASELARELPGAFDVATMWGVIEHLSDPAAVVRDLGAALRPGGVIAIWTGDCDGAMARLLGRRWWYWMGQHIQYFTARSLRRLLEDAGFSVLEESTYPYAASHETISNSLRRYPGARLLSALIRPLFTLRPVWRLRLPGELFVLARKRPS